MLIVGHLVGYPVKAIQPCTFCTDPGIALLIHIDRNNGVPTECIWIFGIIAIVRKIIALAVVFVDAASIGAEPHHAAPIFIDGDNIIQAQAFREGWVVSIVNKTCTPAAQAI